MAAEPKKLETWESAIKGTIGVKKYDRRGDLTTEIVRGGRKLHLTPDERRYNTEAAASLEQDPFSNGMLVPVQLVEDEEEFADNPNVISASDMSSLFELHWKQFDERLATITNVSTLMRLIELASADDADVTVRQMNSIKARVMQVDPSIVLDDGDGDSVTSYGDPRDDFAKAVSPS